MVEWIEIYPKHLTFQSWLVSTLVVEWIEIGTGYPHHCNALVSTLVVEWIEILNLRPLLGPLVRLHPRGGVD